MPAFSMNQRLKIALGGFLVFTGFLIVISTILSLTKTVRFELVFQPELFVPIVVIIGALDVACGIILIHKK